MSVGQSKTIPGKYQAKVGRMQDADRMYLKEDGYLAFVDHEFSGAELRNWLKSQFQVCTIGNTIAGDVSMVPSLFSYAYGYHMVSVPTGCSKMSMKLPLPSAGMYMCIDFANAVGNAVMSLHASGVAGVSVIRAGGSALTGFAIIASARLGLICLTDGTWSVIESNMVTAQAV